MIQCSETFAKLADSLQSLYPEGEESDAVVDGRSFGQIDGLEKRSI